MSDKPPLLWHSNAPTAGTGYGAQTALFATRLKEHFALSISAFYGVEGAVIPWNGIPLLPGIANTHGNETILEHARTVFGAGHERDGLTVTLMDVWVLDPHIWSELNVASWVPVDHDPAPRPVVDFFHASGAVPIAMSRFGEQMLRDAGLDPLYVPHAVDTEALSPRPKQEAREEMGLPDTFIVGMVAANKGNPSRKCFVEAFLAFKAHLAKHPDSLLYMHTEASGRFQGVNLPAALNDCGVPQEKVVWCDQYRASHFPFPPEHMANVYSSLDVLLAPSAGEGFGIPVIEAQACGTPVIVSDFSAQPELVGAGWTVSGSRTYTPIGSWQFRPDVADIADALEQARESRGSEEFAVKARDKALLYDIDAVMAEHMLPALSEAAERLEDRPVELVA